MYCAGRDPELLVDADQVEGEGPVKGFRLKLKDIWKGA
jgi:hypothetical protein